MPNVTVVQDNLNNSLSCLLVQSLEPAEGTARILDRLEFCHTQNMVAG